MTQAFQYIGGMFSASVFSNPATSLKGYNMKEGVIYGLLGIATLLLIEWMQREKAHGLEIEERKATVLRWASYSAIIVLIFLFRQTGGNLDFIYFQF